MDVKGVRIDAKSSPDPMDWVIKYLIDISCAFLDSLSNAIGIKAYIFNSKPIQVKYQLFLEILRTNPNAFIKMNKSTTVIR